ncbi:hypothetical protein [Absidia glauca]|uniref:CCHC-type domain-containing protein n=1 Tax=Absidia glauca TaxID=4829 RepID=A0A168MWB8_ABSGL|nr:hypothetical protein [Absidia glauca]
MYDDDEEDLALLQQYEEQQGGSSDLEDRIMSAVEYGTNQLTDGSKRSKQQQRPKESTEQESKSTLRSTIPPIDMTQPGTDRTTQNNSRSGEDSSDDDSDSSHNCSSIASPNSPPVIHHIDLAMTDKQLPYDDSTDEEEKELNFELQQLIDNQIHNRNQKKQKFKPSRKPIVCNTCGNPGHMRYQCDLCADCGMKRHATSYCPGLEYCRRCKERGHLSSECENPICRDSCRHCGDYIHASQCCPSLVHVYTGEVSPQKAVKRFCYNCGGKGHFGDECPTLSTRLQAQLSVFSARHLSLASALGHQPPRGGKRHHHHQQHQHHQHHQGSTGHIHKRWPDRMDLNEDRHSRKRSKSNHGDERHDKPKHRQHNTSKERYVSSSNQDTSSKQRASGNNNWKALTKGGPSSSRSGGRQPSSSNRIENDFPRGGGGGGGEPTRSLPKPSFSGVVAIDPSTRRPSIAGRSVISPPPPYTSIQNGDDDKRSTYLYNYRHHQQTEVEKTVSKMQEVIETTYLMMQESQKRLVRLECSNQLLVTGLTQWMNHNNNRTTSSSSTPSTTTSSTPSSTPSSTTDPDYARLLDTMTTTVQHLLDEAETSLHQTISPPLRPTINTDTVWALTPDQQQRYQASEQNLDRAFKHLMDQVDGDVDQEEDDSMLLIPPPNDTIITDGPASSLEQSVYHHHHYHYHHHHHHHDTSASPQPRDSYHLDHNRRSYPTEAKHHNDLLAVENIHQNSLLTVFAPTSSLRRVQSWFTSSSSSQSSSSSSSSSSLSSSSSTGADCLISTPPIDLSALSPLFHTLTAQDRRLHRHRIATLIVLVMGRLLLHPGNIRHPRYKRLLSSSRPRLHRQLVRFVFILQFIYHLLT